MSQSGNIIERDNRNSRCGGSLWRMGLMGRDLNDPKNRYNRRLILEPYSTGVAGTTRLEAWIEEDRPVYVYTTEDPRQRPKGPPKWTTEVRELSKSRHTVPVTGLGWTIVKALACNELIGRSASEGIYDLFWECFILNADQLAYLQRHASQEQAKFWAKNRFSTITMNSTDDPVAKFLGDAIADDEPYLACLAWQRAQVDSAFYDAIDAIQLTRESDEKRTEYLLRMLTSQDWRKGKRRG